MVFSASLMPMYGLSTSRDPAPLHEPPSRRAILTLFAAVAVGWLPVLMAHGAVEAIASLAPLATSTQAYFIPRHAAFLYVGVPLVVVSSFLLFLSPGLFVVLALGIRGGVTRWILTGFAASLVVFACVCTAVEAIHGSALRGVAFMVLQVACAFLAMAWVWMRRHRAGAVSWPFRKPGAAADLAAVVLPPLVLLALLTPKIHWENFNGDGIHAFETARLLMVQPLPFWSPVVEDFASFPGVTSMLFAYPASWFMRTFGEVEAAVRLPFVLYLAVMYAGILEIVRHGRVGPAAHSTRWLPWLGLAVYTVVMAYSATYDPYSADIAMPAAQDTLMMVCFLGFVVHFLDRSSLWIALFAGLTILSLPGGVLLMALWLGAVGLLWRPVPRLQMALAGGVLAAGMIVAAIAPRMLMALGLPAPGTEYAGFALLDRLRYVQWLDWPRLAYLVIPAGIVPALALAAWKRQDNVGRGLALVSLSYFALFYFQAYIALHHFVPVMLLPLCVFWRMHSSIGPAGRRIWNAAAVMGALVAGLVSLPENLAPDLSGRRVGHAIQDRTSGYDSMEPAALRRSDILLHLFPYDWDPRVPEQGYGGSPHVWHYYARRAGESQREINYVMQAPKDPPPANMRLVASEPDVALYLRSDALWQRHQALRPSTPAGSRLYRISRDVLFRRLPDDKKREIIDLKSWFKR